jgi:hypothetical protein
VNWFSSYTFKANWFASRWWTHVTVPVTVTVTGAGGGGRYVDWGIPIFETKMCNLFEGQDDHGPLQLQQVEFDCRELFDEWNPRPKAPPEVMRPIKPVAKRKQIRHLDSMPSRTIRRLDRGTKSECSLCRFPAMLQDLYGDMEVVSVFCTSRDRTGRTVRHLG